MNILKAQHVAHNDERHDYNKSGFVCYVDNRSDARLFHNAQEAVDLVRAFALVLDELPGDSARSIKMQADDLLRRLNTRTAARSA